MLFFVHHQFYTAGSLAGWCLAVDTFADDRMQTVAVYATALKQHLNGDGTKLG